MARKLTDPIVPPAITHQAVTQLLFEIPHIYDEVIGAMRIDISEVHVIYTVRTFNDAGTTEKTEHRKVSYPDWPAVFKTGMRDIYAMVGTDAGNNGLLSPGVDDTLE